MINMGEMLDNPGEVFERVKRKRKKETERERKKKIVREKREMIIWVNFRE